jgi:tetratricopeptide (TPR) repeat protein
MTLTARFLAMALCLAFAIPAFCGEPQWVEIHSPHFSVITDAGDRRGRDVAVRFEQMRAVFGSLMVKAKVNTPVPLQIIAFRNSKELRQFTPIWKGKATQLAGLFQGGADRCFILLDMSAENPWQVVFHEYAHQLMNGTLSEQFDPWFEEGFAEYFRTITVDGREADVGKIPEDEYYVLERVGWMKLGNLFRVQQYSDTYNGNNAGRDVFYAESGMLVHYLYDNGLVPKVGDYYTLVRDKHVPIDAAIQQAFGMSPVEFDKALHTYASSGRFKYYKLAAPAGSDSKSYTSAPLSSVNARVILADAHLHSSDYQKAAGEEFGAVLKEDPNNAAALRGLGYSYLMKHDLEKAGEYFHRSAALNSNDPRVLYYSAVLSFQENAASLGGDTSRVQSMQRELEQSIKLDPDFADTYSVLASTYELQGKVEPAIAVSQKAIELNPRNTQYRFQLAELFLRHKQMDDAMTVLRVLQSSSDAQVVAQAAERLEQVQEYRERVQSATQFSSPQLSSRGSVGQGPHQVEVVAPEAASSGAPVVANYLKGELLSVDCSTAPAATLTVLVGRKTWRLHTANSAKTVIIGADQLSCSWTKQKVAVNYRETGDGQGDIISLEVQ